MLYLDVLPNIWLESLFKNFKPTPLASYVPPNGLRFRYWKEPVVSSLQPPALASSSPAIPGRMCYYGILSPVQEHCCRAGREGVTSPSKERFNNNILPWTRKGFGFWATRLLMSPSVLPSLAGARQPGKDAQSPGKGQACCWLIAPRGQNFLSLMRTV